PPFSKGGTSKAGCGCGYGCDCDCVVAAVDTVAAPELATTHNAVTAESHKPLDPRHVCAFVDVSHMLQRKARQRAKSVSVTRNGAIADTGSCIRGQSAAAPVNTRYRD
ncbi:MAG: hypothetical protein ACREP7_13705, partial [Lysobacter sp.]